MKIEEIFNEWERDSSFDRTELGDESLRTPKLHHKYFKFFSNERLILRKLEADYKSLYKDKYEYYTGILDEVTLRQNGWEPFQLKILKTDVSTYMDADDDIIKISLRIGMQKEKIDALESIIRTITNRGFAIKNAIDWEKFKTGI